MYDSRRGTKPSTSSTALSFLPSGCTLEILGRNSLAQSVRFCAQSPPLWGQHRGVLDAERFERWFFLRSPAMGPAWIYLGQGPRGATWAWEMPQACASAAALTPHCAIPRVPHPSCPRSASSSACSPRGRLAPGRSWTRMMGTSTALSLLQSELKIPVFLCGVHGRPEGWEESSALGYGALAGCKM